MNTYEMVSRLMLYLIRSYWPPNYDMAYACLLSPWIWTFVPMGYLGVFMSSLCSFPSVVYHLAFCLFWFQFWHLSCLLSLLLWLMVQCLDNVKDEEINSMLGLNDDLTLYMNSSHSSWYDEPIGENPMWFREGMKKLWWFRCQRWGVWGSKVKSSGPSAISSCQCTI